MYQTFETRGDRAAAENRLPMLRERMAALDVDGLLVPHDDEYLNEYTPPQFERLLWLTGLGEYLSCNSPVPWVARLRLRKLVGFGRDPFKLALLDSKPGTTQPDKAILRVLLEVVLH